MSYISNILDGLSHLLNRILGNKTPEGVSGRAYRTNSKWVRVLDCVFFWDEHHCLESHIKDIAQIEDLIEEITDES